MRIPLKNRHYLTDAYVKEFNLPTRDFYNIDPDHNCFVSVRGKPVRVEGKYTNAGYMIMIII